MWAQKASWKGGMVRPSPTLISLSQDLAPKMIVLFKRGFLCPSSMPLVPIWVPSRCSRVALTSTTIISAWKNVQTSLNTKHRFGHFKSWSSVLDGLSSPLFILIYLNNVLTFTRLNLVGDERGWIPFSCSHLWSFSISLKKKKFWGCASQWMGSQLVLAALERWDFWSTLPLAILSLISLLLNWDGKGSLRAQHCQHRRKALMEKNAWEGPTPRKMHASASPLHSLWIIMLVLLFAEGTASGCNKTNVYSWP